jgi:hypothetical protein
MKTQSVSMPLQVPQMEVVSMTTDFRRWQEFLNIAVGSVPLGFYLGLVEQALNDWLFHAWPGGGLAPRLKLDLWLDEKTGHVYKH